MTDSSEIWGNIKLTSSITEFTELKKAGNATSDILLIPRPPKCTGKDDNVHCSPIRRELISFSIVDLNCNPYQANPVQNPSSS